MVLLRKLKFTCKKWKSFLDRANIKIWIATLFQNSPAEDHSAYQEKK